MKEEHLYVGSSGMEWITPEGNIDNYNAMWVKRVNRYGRITNINWKSNYEALRAALGASYPGIFSMILKYCRYFVLYFTKNVCFVLL